MFSLKRKAGSDGDGADVMVQISKRHRDEAYLSYNPDRSRLQAQQVYELQLQQQQLQQAQQQQPPAQGFGFHQAAPAQAQQIHGFAGPAGYLQGPPDSGVMYNQHQQEGCWSMAAQQQSQAAHDLAMHPNLTPVEAADWSLKLANMTEEGLERLLDHQRHLERCSRQHVDVEMG